MPGTPLRRRSGDGGRGCPHSGADTDAVDAARPGPRAGLEARPGRRGGRLFSSRVVIIQLFYLGDFVNF